MNSRDDEIRKLEEEVSHLLKRIDLLKQLRAMEVGTTHLAYNRFAKYKRVVRAIEDHLAHANKPLPEEDIVFALTMGGYPGFRDDPEAARYSVSQSVQWNSAERPRGTTTLKVRNGLVGLLTWPDEKWPS